MPTDYDAGHKSRLYVKSSRQPIPAKGNWAEAPREERDTSIKLATIGFQTRRLPGEDKWPMQVIPSKVVE